MNTALLIARRELAAYLRTMSGYVIITVMLFIVGLLFNVYAMAGTAKRSSEALTAFFYFCSGITLIGSVFLSMRLLAEERQNGTLQLLYSSPVRDWQIVLGKYLSALGFLGVFLLSTAYMPVLLMIYGKISFGHLFAGYFGLLLVGSASLAVGTFGSSLTKSQVVAAVITGVMLTALTITWMLASITERPLTDVVGAFWWYGHFKPFESGVIQLRNVVYFVVVTWLSLFASTRVLEARRWR